MNRLTVISFIISTAAISTIGGILYLQLSGPVTYKSRLVFDNKEVTKTYSPFEDKKLEEEIKEILKNTEGTYSVAISSLTKDTQIMIDEKETFQAASTMKLLTAIAIYKKVEEGTYSLSTQIGDTNIEILIESMINRSDNDSWDILNNLIGFDSVQQVAIDNKLNNTSAYENFTTAEDMVILLDNIYQGKVLSSSHTTHLLSLMQNTETENRLPKGFSPQSTIYHKTGTLLPYAFHDVGIVKIDGTTLIVAVMGKDTTEEEGVDVISSVAEAIETNLFK